MAESPRQFTHFHRAWADYLADELPANTYLGERSAVLRIPDLLSLREQADVLLLDGFGVLNTGFEAVEGMADQIAQLQRQGVHCLVLSNGATQPVGPMVQKYTDLGYHFAPEDLLTSRDALRVALRRHHAEHPGFLWGVTPTASADHPDLSANLRQLHEAADFEAADGILLLSTLRWSARLDWLLYKQLQTSPKPVWVGNPDVCAPFPTYVSREPGQVARALERGLGMKIQYFGKPHGNIYDVAFARVAQLTGQIDKSRIVMVGDSPHTDILGARQAGIKSVLIQDHGLLAGQNLRRRLEEARIWPDYVIAKDFS
ncbi:MAG: HAD-IIA family hydrolase [Granulosicoccaceae bacterium]